MSADVKTAKFRALELNERNVNTLFKRCLPDEEELQHKDSLKNAQVLTPQLCGKESEKCLLSKKKTQDHRTTILYLLGQLKPIDPQNEGVTLQFLQLTKYFKNISFALQEGFLRYDDVFWTKDYDVLFKLYSMGLASYCLMPFSSDNAELISTVAVDDLVPTISPRDPNYATWWEEHKGEWE